VVLVPGDRLALAPGQLVARQHAVAVAVHLLEGVAHPGQVLGQRHAAVAIGIHLRQIVAGALDLGRCRAHGRTREQQRKRSGGGRVGTEGRRQCSGHRQGLVVRGKVAVAT